MAKSHQVSEELKNIAISLSEISLMSHQISEAASEQLTAGEDSAIRIVNISETAENTASVSHSSHATSAQIQLLTMNLEKEVQKFAI
ncbi:hypothetical protein [Shewanella psychrophila]|uniref:hypothetical protein n=1 Tax=Shewanella psychrophila TaxID=225848 RepID=UPI000989F7C0|nr:hypothetical protein [Shewanella psychrophila]